jgi:hypothetical protein
MLIERLERRNMIPVGRVTFALFALVSAWLAQAPTYAQDSYEYPEDLFYELLDEYDYSLDDARAVVAEALEFDEYQAAEVAAYLCAPDPDEACRGSSVLALWNRFLDGLSEDESIDDIVDEIGESDPILAEEIAIYWCTPPAGYGCDEEEYSERQSEFVVEDQAKGRPVSGSNPGGNGGAQFFGGDKRGSRTRGGRSN